MALNFPDSPTLNQVYTDSTSGFSYQWDGTVWQSYTSPASKNISILDDISGSFDGVTDTFALTVSSTSLTPANAQQLRVVLGGIVQEPLTDYTVSGSDITFTTPPSGGLDCSIVSLGPAVPVNTIIDGTVTPAKLSTGGPSWNTDGDVYISGITTIADVVKVGVGTTSLIVEGDARITGILTIGTSSITLDGSNNEIKIGTGVTISSTGITGSASTVTSSSISYGLEGTPNITVGFITATGASISGNVDVGGNVSIAGTLTYEDVTNIDSIGIVTARSGIVLGPTSNTIQLGTGTTISSPSSNTFTISTNGSERVRVDSSGRLGIGNTSPDTKLDLDGAFFLRPTSESFPSENGGGLRLRSDTSTLELRGLQWTPSVVYYDIHYLGLQHYWSVNGSEKARIDSSGRFGLGETNPPTKLYVSGSAASNIVALGNVSTNTALDLSTGNNFSLTLTGSITLSNPSNLTVGQSGIILIQQDGSGSKTCAFGSYWDFPSGTAPTLSTGANALDCITYFVRSSTSIVANSLIGIGPL